MKKILLAFISFASIQILNAQNTIGLQSDLRGVLASGGSVNNTTISTFSIGDVKGTRYLFNNWTQGSVTTFANENFSSGYTFNYDKINQDIYAKYTGQAELSVLLDKSKIKYFSIGGLKFINSIVIDPKSKQTFLQLLAGDTTGIGLYKQTITKFVKADLNNLMTVKTGDFSSKYEDDVKYFVKIDGEIKKINLSESNIRKTLKSKSSKVDEYFNLNSNKEMDENLLADLVNYINH